MKLFRLKSNRNTVVHRLEGDLFGVMWSNQMENGFDSRWMISTQSPENLEELTKEEREALMKKVKAFDERGKK